MVGDDGGPMMADEVLPVRLTDWRLHLEPRDATGTEDNVVVLRRLDIDLPLRADDRRPVVRALHVRLSDDALTVLVRVASDLLRDRLLALRERLLQRLPFFVPKKPFALLFDAYGVGTLQIGARFEPGTVELVPRAPLLAGTNLRLKIDALTDGRIRLQIEDVHLNHLSLKFVLNLAAQATVDNLAGVQWTANDSVVLNPTVLITGLGLPIRWSARAQRLSITPGLFEAEFEPEHESPPSSR